MVDEDTKDVRASGAARESPTLEAESVRDLRSGLGLDRAALSDRLDVPVHTVRGWESGDEPCRGESARALVELAVDSDEISLFLLEKRHESERYRPQLQVRRRPYNGANTSAWRGRIADDGAWRQRAHGGFSSISELVAYVREHVGESIDVERLREEADAVASGERTASAPLPFESDFEYPEESLGAQENQALSINDIPGNKTIGRLPSFEEGVFYLVVLAVLAVAAYAFVYYYLEPMLQ